MLKNLKKRLKENPENWPKNEKEVKQEVHINEIILKIVANTWSEVKLTLRTLMTQQLIFTSKL